MVAAVAHYDVMLAGNQEMIVVYMGSVISDGNPLQYETIQNRQEVNRKRKVSSVRLTNASSKFIGVL